MLFLFLKSYSQTRGCFECFFFIRLFCLEHRKTAQNHLSLLLTETLKGFVSGYRHANLAGCLEGISIQRSSLHLRLEVWGPFVWLRSRRGKRKKKHDLELPWEKIRHVSHTIHVWVYILHLVDCYRKCR